MGHHVSSSVLVKNVSVLFEMMFEKSNIGLIWLCHFTVTTDMLRLNLRLVLAFFVQKNSLFVT